MMWWILAVVVVIALPLVLWYRADAADRALKLARERELALKQEQNQKLKEIIFRKHGEAGVSNTPYGDIMCADGVYLPRLWESGFATSMDGRWLRISGYGQASPYLVDRKKRCTWTLSAEEASALEEIHWRLPRWSGETVSVGAMHNEAQAPMTEGQFAAWLASNVANSAMPMAALRDLWVPWDAMPAQKEEVPPDIPLPPSGGRLVGVQRYWPESLRTERQPLELFTKPQWQLLFDGQPQPWVVATDLPFSWREDGNALAMYAYSVAQGNRQQRVALAVWESERGWQKWAEQQPPDRKPWELSPAPEEPGQPAFRWMKDRLLQRVRIDIPVLQRFRHGSHIEYHTDEVLVPAGHQEDGRLELRPAPITSLLWERQLQHPDRWLARSEPVAGKSLSWTLELPASATSGERAAYRLRWGEVVIPGLWELEHVIVQRTWAVLLRYLQNDGQDGKEGEAQVCIWDGKELLPLDLPWPVARITPTPSARAPKSLRVRVLAMVGVVKESDADLRKPTWRWYQEPFTWERLEKTEYTPLYEVRDIVPDNQGVWRLLPSWRTIATTQHPCADGDYFWAGDVKDELWWFGGMRQYTPEQPQDDALVPRCHGISVTRSGAVLCGTGPAAYPNPNGDGWLLLEPPERPAYGGVTTWTLYWLQPQRRLVRNLIIQAAMPLIEGWDNQGIYWREDVPHAASAEEGQPEAPAQRPLTQTIDPTLWQRAEVQDLKQGPYGLWLRKEDMLFAEAIRKHRDWPWEALIK